MIIDQVDFDNVGTVSLVRSPAVPPAFTKTRAAAVHCPVSARKGTDQEKKILFLAHLSCTAPLRLYSPWDRVTTENGVHVHGASTSAHHAAICVISVISFK